MVLIAEAFRATFYIQIDIRATLLLIFYAPAIFDLSFYAGFSHSL